MFSKKATKNYKIFTADLTLTNKRQIDGEDFVIFVAFLENMNFTSIEIGDRLGSLWFSISRDRFEYTVSLGYTYSYPRSPLGTQIIDWFWT